MKSWSRRPPLELSVNFPADRPDFVGVLMDDGRIVRIEVPRTIADGAQTPMVFSCSCELPALEGCELEYLLMPVQLRNWGK